MKERALLLQISFSTRQSTYSDFGGNSTWDRVKTAVKVSNVDGSTTETIDNRRNNNTLLNRETITISGNALMKTIATDFNGDGLADNTVLTQTTLNTNGSSQVFAKQISLNGTVILTQWINVTANG